MKTCHFLLQILAAMFIVSWPATASGAKILGIFAHPSESHFTVMRSVTKELARRGHNVHIYSSHRLEEQIENLREIVIEPTFPFWSKLQEAAGVKHGLGLYGLSQLSSAKLQKVLGVVGAAAVEHFLSHVVLQELLNLQPTSFDYDLIIIDLFYTEALLSLGHVYHAVPVIGIISTDFANYMQNVQENVVPAACSPIDYEMNSVAQAEVGFSQRLSTIRACMTRRKEFMRGSMGEQEKIIKKFFSHFDAAPRTVAELYSNLTVLLVNNHIPLATPRPTLQNIIAVGGLHIRPPKELPWNIRRFLEESRIGVIYVNLGNEQLCAEIPKDKLRIFFAVFSKMKERILWTCHDVEKLEDMPKNMMIQHMVPQTDIIAHPHIKAFIMNGDLLSLQEGIVRHVPMVGIPIFSNEVHNMELAEEFGVGIKLAYTNVTEASLTWALQLVMQNANYPAQIRKISSEFRDRPLGALEHSMFWVDYILRHNHGLRLKTRGVGVASHQLHLFDLFIFYFSMALIIAAALVGAYYLGYYLWKRRQVEKIYNKLN